MDVALGELVKKTEDALDADDEKASFVYLLQSTEGSRTYVGATVDLDRRLRQHNRELSGGAKATRQGPWRRIAYVAGFPNWRAALQFEWRWKYQTRGVSEKNAIVRRAKALHQMLKLPRSTSSAMLFSDWPTPPRVVAECATFDQAFKAC